VTSVLYVVVFEIEGFLLVPKGNIMRREKDFLSFSSVTFVVA
jgi:hypothetical protein